MSRGSCTNPKENFRLRQEEYKKHLDGMIECEDCNYGFIPNHLGQSICDDCIENRQYWLEVEAERQSQTDSDIKI